MRASRVNFLLLVFIWKKTRKDPLPRFFLGERGRALRYVGGFGVPYGPSVRTSTSSVPRARARCTVRNGLIKYNYEFSTRDIYMYHSNRSTVSEYQGHPAI
jgi:hypothetical protein